jgi:hypothetical protein
MEAPAEQRPPPRASWRAGPPIALALWTAVVAVDRLTAHTLATAWTVFALLCCLCGLLVTVGRSLARRSDGWEPALVAGLASLAGPLSLLLLLFPGVRLALQEIPLLAKSRETRQLGHDRLRARAAERRRTVTPASTAVPLPVPAPGKRFLFGDLRRPRSMAVVLVGCIAIFPVCWLVLLVAYGLAGESGSTQHAERVILVLAAIPSAIGVLGATVDRFRARHIPDGRGATLLSREGLVSGIAVLAAFGGAAAFAVWLWNSVL